MVSNAPRESWFRWHPRQRRICNLRPTQAPFPFESLSPPFYFNTARSAPSERCIDLYARRNGRFEVNNKQAAIISTGHLGGPFDYPAASYAERERIFADHWDYSLGWLLPYQLYVREAPRMQSAFVATQKDAISERRKPDAVGISSHFFDAHHVQRVALSKTECVNEGRIWRIGWAYQIPYRAIFPKESECSNLLVPGAASSSPVAFSSYRLEKR